MSNDEWSVLSVNLREDTMELLEKHGESKSGKARKILQSWLNAEDEYGVRDDVTTVELAVLKAYRNAIAKNIQAMQAQHDKLDNRIEEMQEEDDGGEVLFEVDLRMKQWDM